MVEKKNECVLGYSPMGLPVIIVFDEKGEVIGDIIRSFAERVGIQPEKRKEEGIPESVTTLSVGLKDCGEGSGDFYEAMVNGVGEARFCSLREALKWVKEKSGKSCV